MGYIMTFDVGTTSIKTCLFTQDFDLVAYASEEYGLLTPEKNTIELPPDTYWMSLKKGISEVLRKSGISVKEILVITLTTQGETLIPMDYKGDPLNNAIVWLDGRATEETDIIRGLIDKYEFYRKTGMPEIGPACPICKILWFKRNRLDMYEKIYKFLLLEDYLLFRLTGKFVSEQSLLSSTGYFNINNGELWHEVLDAIEINEDLFPNIMPCGKTIGNLTDQAALELGLNTSTTVSTGAMDQISSAIGAGNIYPGIFTETTGTALVMGTTIPEVKFDNVNRVNIYRHYDDKFLMLPYCPTAGIVLKWFKDEFCNKEIEESLKEGISVYQLLDESASVVQPGSNGLILLPYLAGTLSPDTNPYAKGVFFGVNLETKKQHFVRAILESIGYMLRENIELLESMGIRVTEIRSLGGGSSSTLWSSIKADITNLQITIMEQPESTSLGAAILGAVSINLYSSVAEACELHIRAKDFYYPDRFHHDIYNKSYAAYKDIYRHVKELFKP